MIDVFYFHILYVIGVKERSYLNHNYKDFQDNEVSTKFKLMSRKSITIQEYQHSPNISTINRQYEQ